jgi:hypothetical protein
VAPLRATLTEVGRYAHCACLGREKAKALACLVELQSACSIPNLACSAGRWIDRDSGPDYHFDGCHFDARHSLATLALNSTETSAIRRCCDPPHDHLFRDLPVLIPSATRPAACSQMTVRFHPQEISGSRHDLRSKERSWWPPALYLICCPVRYCLEVSLHCHVKPDLMISMALHFRSGLNHSLWLKVTRIWSSHHDRRPRAQHCVLRFVLPFQARQLRAIRSRHRVPAQADCAVS